MNKIPTNESNVYKLEFTKLEKLDLWLFDHIFLYRWLQGIYNFLKPYHLKGVFTRFFQRLTRGWDDSETWNLDERILKFIQPRLKRLAELTICYPDSYKTIEDWKNELIKRSAQLNLLIKYYYEPYYYKKEELKDEKKCIKTYGKDFDDWMYWFSKNITHLGW